MLEYTDSADNAAIVADAGAGDGKALAITACRDDTGRITSARIKLLVGQGIWPAFWMLNVYSVFVGCGWLGYIDACNSFW